jgi:hypothetical protein
MRCMHTVPKVSKVFFGPGGLWAHRLCFRLAFFAVHNNIIVMYVILFISRYTKLNILQCITWNDIRVRPLHGLGSCLLLRVIIHPLDARFVTFAFAQLSRFAQTHVAAGSWPVKKIMWLMVQIWFGNTYLSFVQAESFHPVFGPILMTGVHGGCRFIY